MSGVIFEYVISNSSSPIYRTKKNGLGMRFPKPFLFLNNTLYNTLFKNNALTTRLCFVRTENLLPNFI